jgi:hypothetical protein
MHWWQRLVRRRNSTDRAGQTRGGARRARAAVVAQEAGGAAQINVYFISYYWYCTVVTVHSSMRDLTLEVIFNGTVIAKNDRSGNGTSQ